MVLRKLNFLIVFLLTLVAFQQISKCGPRLEAYINNTVYTPVVDGIKLEIPEELGNKNLANWGYVDITAAPFFADPSGKNDSTRAIQAAVDFSRDHQMVCYFPRGTYTVSDTLSCIQNYYRRANGQIVGARSFPCLLVGSREGPRPKIILAPYSPGFTNPKKPKYIVHFWARFLDSPYKPAPAISMNQMFVNIDVSVGEGNSGAVAIRHRGAQGSGIQDCAIDARCGLTGIEGGCGSGGSHANIIITGGKIGIDLRETQPAPTITGITLIGQEETAILYQGRQALCAVAVKIKSATMGPLIVGKPVRWTPFHGQICLVDSEIIFEKSKGIAISSSSSLYLRNVYVKNSEYIVSNPDGSELKGNKDGWSCIREYAHSVKPSKWKGYQFMMPIYIDGQRSFSDIINLEQNKKPAEDLCDRHLWNSDIPGWNSKNTVNVKEEPYNAKGDGVSDDYRAIQSAIDENDVIFLPKGYYNISKTLKLQSHTKIIGVGKHLSVIMSRSGITNSLSIDAPMPLIQTVDDRNSSPLLNSFGLYVPIEAPLTYCLEWKSGNGIVNDVNFLTFPPIKGFGSPLPRNHISKNYPLILIRGNGGGKWYNFFQEDKRPLSQGPNYTHILIEENKMPLSFYQCNVEHSLGNANMHIRNGRTIDIYGLKGEEKSPILLMENSQFVNIFGYGGNASAQLNDSIFRIEDSFDFSIIQAVDTPILSKKRRDPDRWHMIIENYNNNNILKTMPLDRPLIYRRSSKKLSIQQKTYNKNDNQL